MLKNLQLPATAALFVLVVPILFIVLFDTLSYEGNLRNIDRAQTELPDALTLWQAQHISDYDIDVRASRLPVCFIDVTLSVRNGEIANVVEEADNARIYPPGCEYDTFTIDNTFEIVANTLRSLNALEEAVTVSFDSTYGFVTRYETKFGYRILGSSLGDCCHEWAYSNFHPITSAP